MNQDNRGTWLVDSSDGSLSQASPEEYQALVNAGAPVSRASPQQVQNHLARLESERLEAERQEKFSSTGQELATFAEHAAVPLTFGLSTRAETALGVRPEDIKSRTEINPGVAMAGEITGVVAPALLSGGASAIAEGVGAAGTVARGAEALYAVPRAISGIGRAAEGIAGAVLPEVESGLGRLAVAGAKKFAGGAAEGALYQAANEVSEQAIDPEWTAAALPAHIGMAALFGGGMGAGLGLAEEAGSQIIGSIGKAKQAVQDARPKIEKMIAKLSEGATGTPSEEILSNVELMKGAEGAALDSPMAREKIATDALEGMRKVRTSADDVMRSVASEKQEAFATLAHADPDQVNAALEDFRARTMKQIGEMKADPFTYSPDAVKHLESFVEKMDRDFASTAREAHVGPIPLEKAGTPEFSGYFAGRKAAQAASDKSSVAAKFTALDELKVAMDQRLKVFGNISPEGRAANSVFKGVRHDLRALLEDPEVFGETGAAQHELNESLSRYKESDKALFSEFGNTRLKDLDAKKFNSLMTQAGDARGAQRMDVIREHLDAAKQLSEAAEKVRDLTPTSKITSDELKRLVEVGNERVASADRLAKLSAYMKPSRMSFGSTGMPEAVEHSGHAGGGLGLVTGGVLGHVLGPVLGLTHGGGLGLALGAINKLSELRSSYHGFIGDVPRVVRTLAKMQGAVDHVAATVDRRAGQIVRGISKGSIIRGEVAAGLSQTHAKTPDEQKRVFDRRVAWVEKHQDPDAMVDAIGKGSEHISEHAPTVAAGVGITQQRIISHLSSLIPDRSSAGPLAEPKTVSLASMTRFNQAYEAADRPLSILRQAREGSLSQPALDAVKAIHPALYSRMQRAMVEKIASVKPGEIPRSARATLSRFLGPTDGGAARAISVMRVAQAPKPIPPRAMKLVSKASDRMSTPLDKLSSKV